MRAGFTVDNDIIKEDNFILVGNYTEANEVFNCGAITEKQMLRYKDEHDIGFWRIKRK